MASKTVTVISAPTEKVLPVEEHIKLLLFGDAQNQPCDTCAVSDLEMSLPPWYDKSMYRRGQFFVFKNLSGVTTATFCGVVSVFAVPTMLNILMKAQRSSTEYSAYRRYLSTIMHFRSWYQNRLVPESDAWKSMAIVRKRHIKWSNISRLRKDGLISQRDLVFTLVALGGICLVRTHLLAISDDKKELEAFSHFWRTIGYMLGIEDRYNAFRPSLEETQLVIEAICSGVFKPLIINPPENFYHMTSTFFKGMSMFDPTVSEGATYYFNYRLLGCEGFEYYPNGALEKRQRKEIETREAKLKNIKFKDGPGYSGYPGKNENIVSATEFFKSLGMYNRFLLFSTIFFMTYVYNTILGKLLGAVKGMFIILFAQFLPVIFFYRHGFKGAYVDKYKESEREVTVIKTNKEILAENRL